MVRKLRRDYGVIILCDGTDETSCSQRLQTANVRVDMNRLAAAAIGWGRGLRKGRKRRDLCSYHYKLEKFLLSQEQWARALDMAKKDEARKAKLSPNPTPKKPRKKKAEPVEQQATA